MKRLSVIIVSVIAAAAAFTSCDYREYAPADYPDTVIYLPAAVNGVWTIDETPVPETFIGEGNKSFYDIDPDGKKLHIHLGVVQAGIVLGNYEVQLVSSKSTVNRMLDEGTLPNDILPLPESVYKFPEAVFLTSSSDHVSFDVDVTTSYLKDPEYLGKRFAIAIKISSEQVATNPAYETVVIVIDPKVVKQ